MMIIYYKRLFDYDRHINQLMLKSISENNAPVKAVQLMAHLLAAQQIWLGRCAGMPASGVKLWPDWKADVFAGIIMENHKNWIAYLDGREIRDLENGITYQNSKGDKFCNNLGDILTHVINHGTHHRAQAGQQLKLAGAENLPVTDYIFYVRNEDANLS